MTPFEILTNTVIPYVANEILDVYKKKYVTTGVKKLLLPEKDYKIQLIGILRKAIDNFEVRYPPVGKFPFYHHKETFARLSKFLLFEDGDRNILREIDFGSIRNIDQPTQDQIERFYDFIVGEIKSDAKLKQLYVEENYKAKIFEIYRDITAIKGAIAEFKRSLPEGESLIHKWIGQIQYNLQSLKTRTALEEITRFEQDILPAIEISDENISFIHFVKGLCLNENGKSREALTYFSSACRLKKSANYLSWKLYLMYAVDDPAEALQQAKSAIRSNPFDPLLNTIITRESLNNGIAFGFSDVSVQMQRNLRFKRNIYLHFLKENQNERALELLKTDTGDIDQALTNISIDNYGYLDYYLQLSFLDLLRDFPDSRIFLFNKDLQKSDRLGRLIGYQQRYLEAISDAEIEGLRNRHGFLHEIAMFYLTGDRIHLDKAYGIYHQDSFGIPPIYFCHVKYGYAQVGEYRRTLELFDEHGYTPDEYYNISMLYYQIGNIEKAEDSLVRYCQNLSVINEENIALVLNVVLHGEISYEYLKGIYDRLENGELPADGIYRDLVLSTRGIWVEVFREDSRKILENTNKLISSLTDIKSDLVISYCKILNAYQFWTDTIRILSPRKLIDFDAKRLMIDALYHSKAGGTLLLEKLVDFRNSTDVQIPEYYVWEMDLLSHLGDWEQVERIAIMGQEDFNSQVFNYYHSMTLYNQHRNEDFVISLQNLDIYELRFENFDVIIRGLLHANRHDLVIENVYQYALKHNDPQLRTYYFSHFVNSYEKAGFPKIAVCENGHYVRIKGPQTDRYINSGDEGEFFKLVIGKSVGVTVESVINFTGVIKTYEITEILDRYQYLFRKIQEEAIDADVSGIGVTSFQFEEGSTPEQMTRQLISLFGKSGDERKDRVERVLEQYRMNKVSYMELARAISNDDVIQTYNALNASPGIGYRIIPSSIFSDRQITQKVCLDVMAVLILSELQRTYGFNYDRTFVISRHTNDYYLDLLNAMQNEKVGRLSLNITSKAVQTWDMQEYNDLKISVIRHCVNWISGHCEISTSPSKLDVIVKMQGMNADLNNFILSFLDTVLIALDNGYTAVTDERVFFRSLHNAGSVICIEYLLKNVAKDVTGDQIYLALSKNNFVGIEIPMEKADEIAKKLLSGDSLENFHQNIEIGNGASPHNIHVVANIIRILYEDESAGINNMAIIRKLNERLFNDLYDKTGLLENIISLLQLSLYRAFRGNITGFNSCMQETFELLSRNGIEIDTGE